jgi:hypothetical protein
VRTGLECGRRKTAAGKGEPFEHPLNPVIKVNIRRVTQVATVNFCYDAILSPNMQPSLTLRKGQTNPN